jgi:cobalt/nickel transport protein
MDKIYKYLLIGLALLIVLTPLGLISTGETYGEWGGDYLQETLGYIPSGLSGLADLWHAPLPDYGLPGQGESLADMTPGYLLSAIIGVALCGGLLYFGGKALIKNKE